MKRADGYIKKHPGGASMMSPASQTTSQLHSWWLNCPAKSQWYSYIIKVHHLPYTKTTQMPMAKFFQSTWGAQWMRSMGRRGVLMQKLKKRPNKAFISNFLAQSLYHLAMSGKCRANRWFIMALMLKISWHTGDKDSYLLDLAHGTIGAKKLRNQDWLSRCHLERPGI